MNATQYTVLGQADLGVVTLHAADNKGRRSYAIVTLADGTKVRKMLSALRAV